MIQEALLAGAAQRAAKNLVIPVRMPSYTDIPFWGDPVTITRARPVDPGGGWVDFLEVPVRNLNARVIYRYGITTETANVAEFRWILGNTLLSVAPFTMTPGIERHLDRFVVHPYPVNLRDTFIFAKSKYRLRIQVRNLTIAQQYVWGIVYGWYYPSLESPNEITPQEGIDDTVRDF